MIKYSINRKNINLYDTDLPYNSKSLDRKYLFKKKKDIIRKIISKKKIIDYEKRDNISFRITDVPNDIKKLREYWVYDVKILFSENKISISYVYKDLLIAIDVFYLILWILDNEKIKKIYFNDITLNEEPEFFDFLELAANHKKISSEIIIEFQSNIEDVCQFIYTTNKWETNSDSFEKAINDLRNKNTQL